MLVFSDLHEEDVYLERLGEHAKEGFDYILIAGDSANHLASFIEDVVKTFPDAYIIPGNNEDRNTMSVLSKTKNYLHGKRIEISDGLNVVGFGFSNPTPFHTANELNEGQIYEKMEKLNIDGKTILLLHAVPFEVLDEVKGTHVGSKSIRKIIEEKKPFLAVCGHLHEIEGVDKIGETIVVKVPAAEFGKFCTIKIIDGKVSAQFREI